MVLTVTVFILAKPGGLLAKKFIEMYFGVLTTISNTSSGFNDFLYSKHKFYFV